MMMSEILLNNLIETEWNMDPFLIKFVTEVPEEEEENQNVKEEVEEEIELIDEEIETIKFEYEEDDECETLCSKCGKIMNNTQLEHHLELNKCGKNACMSCDSVFETAEELFEHQQSHAENPKAFSCSTCLIIFNSATELATHNYRHYLKYSCPYCSFGTRSRNSLVYHIRRHDNNFDYICNICQRGFVGKAVFEQHLEVHADIKKYQCEYCEKKFTVQRYLDVHKKLNHKKELFGFDEIFQCDICLRKFSFEKSLRRHLSCMHGVGKSLTVECPVCQKQIANQYNLKIHMRIHTGEKRYVCHQCGKAFSSYKYYKKHVISNHEKNKDKADKDVL